jgi:hypothetical protein
MKRLTLLLSPLLLPAMLPSCTVAISKSTKPLPEIPESATRSQVHQILGEPAASRTLSPPIPIGKDPLLHRKGAPLSLRNDRRPVSLRESFVLKGRYRKPGDPDGTGGLAEMSAKAYWLPEIFLGPFASLEWIARSGHHTRFTVWFSPDGREVFSRVE